MSARVQLCASDMLVVINESQPITHMQRQQQQQEEEKTTTTKIACTECSGNIHTRIRTS